MLPAPEGAVTTEGSTKRFSKSPPASVIFPERSPEASILAFKAPPVTQAAASRPVASRFLRKAYMSRMSRWHGYFMMRSCLPYLPCAPLGHSQFFRTADTANVGSVAGVGVRPRRPHGGVGGFLGHRQFGVLQPERPYW